MTLKTTGQAITDSLVAHGIDTVFGIPGAHMYDFNDVLDERHDRIRFITTRHGRAALSNNID
jgi:acetolactate synthase-1/2/3 large subunit